MRAHWLWTTWAHLSVGCLILMQLLWIWFAVIILVPKFMRLLRDELIDPRVLHEQGVDWMVSFLQRLSHIGDRYATFIVLGGLAGWGLFEWRVRGENKSFIRLSVLGSAAVGLAAVSIVMAGSLVIPYMLGAPAIVNVTRPFMVDQITKINRSIQSMDAALAKEDWQTLDLQALRVDEALRLIHGSGPAMTSLTERGSSSKVDEIRTYWTHAVAAILEVQRVIGERDPARTKSEVLRFQKSYEPIHLAAKLLSGPVP